MNLFSKALLTKTLKSEYINYIIQIAVVPTNRLKIDSVADDFSFINLSNITSSIAYLHLYLDTEKYKIICDDEKLYNIVNAGDYYNLHLRPTNYQINETYSFNCYVADINDEKKLLQEITINYTRTV